MEQMTPLVQDVCCLAAGVILQKLKLLNDADGEAAVKLLAWGTAPALVLQALTGQGKLTSLHFVSFGCGIIYSLACQAWAWWWFRKNYERQKAVLMGCSVGSSLLLWSFPLAESVFGTVGLQSAILFNLANIFAEHVLSYLNFASAGPAFPESYVHQDGSAYRGQWDGLNKQGVGTYKYNSGATYEGEWKENQKSGRGVYYFTKGGLYEGEWLDGNRNGVGVRTFSNGSMQAGRWLNNKLVSSLDFWQCTDAVVAATQAAKAARNVHVGGGKISDTLQVLQQPILWATASALFVNFSNMNLLPTIHVLTKTLASVHRPLALITAGLTFPFALCHVKQVFPSLMVAGIRLEMALLLSSSAAFVCYHYVPELTPFILPLLLVSLAPVSLQAMRYAREFRLNEELTATTVCISSVASSLLMFEIAAAMVITRSLVRHSSLCLRFAKINAIAAAALIVILSIAAWYFRPSSKQRLVLRKFQTASELNTRELRAMLQRPDNPPADTADASISSKDEKRGPSAPQAHRGDQRYSALNSRLKPVGRFAQRKQQRRVGGIPRLYLSRINVRIF